MLHFNFIFLISLPIKVAFSAISDEDIVFPTLYQSLILSLRQRCYFGNKYCLNGSDSDEGPVFLTLYRSLIGGIFLVSTFL